MISCCISSISSSASSRSMILMATTCWVLLSMPLNTSPKLPFPIRSCFVNISSGSTFCEQITNYLPSNEKVTATGGREGGAGRERGRKRNERRSGKDLAKLPAICRAFCQISRGCYNGESLNGFYGGLAW